MSATCVAWYLSRGNTVTSCFCTFRPLNQNQARVRTVGGRTEKRPSMVTSLHTHTAELPLVCDQQ